MKKQRNYYGLQASPPFVLARREEEDVNLQLWRPSPCKRIVLFGKVTDECLEPVASATVKVFSKRLQPLFHTHTDSRGCYCFDGELPSGTYYVAATADPYLTTKLKRIVLHCGDKVERSFLLKINSLLSNAIVYGKVLQQENAQPIAGCTVQLQRTYDDKCKEMLSLEDGEFLFYDVKPGWYRLVAFGSGYECKRSHSFMLHAGMWYAADIELQPAIGGEWGTISGRVKIGNEPAVGIPVLLFRIIEQQEYMIQVQMTERKGVYLFGGVEQGSYIVRAAHPNGTVLLNEKRQV